MSYQEVDLTFQYAPEFRRPACERLLAGESVVGIAEELAVSTHTLYRWRRQALVDVGRLLGPKSFGVDPLARARRKIKDLEKEPTLVRCRERPL